MYGEFTFLQSKLHAMLNAIANGVKLSRLALDQDKSRLPTQPGKKESLEDVVCHLILLALDGDGLGGDRRLIKTPRTLQILNSDTRLRSIGVVLRARGCAEDKTTKEKGYCPLLDIHTTYTLDRLKSCIPEERIWQASHSRSGQSEGMKRQRLYKARST